MLLFLCVNIYSIYDIPCHHCVNWTGFPLPVFVELPPFSGEKDFFWFSIVIDIFVAIFFSFIVGLIFKFIWSKISARRVELK